jgi:5-methyltetrahydropteroyltriglutamate--homocysteine methyltransferase
VGSFLRAPELAAAREEGVAPERLRAIEDKCILRLLAKQKELGLEIFTDGEIWRRNFMSDFTDATDGFDPESEVARDWDASKGKPKTSSVTGVRLHSPGGRKIVRKSNLPAEHTNSWKILI